MGRKALIDAIGFAPEPLPCDSCPLIKHCAEREEACEQYVVFYKDGGEKWRDERRVPSRAIYVRMHRGSIASRQAKPRKSAAAVALDTRETRLSMFMLG